MADSSSLATRMQADDTLEEMLTGHRSSGVRSWGASGGVWERATTNQKFANGQQWPDGDVRRMDESPNKAARLTINEIGPVLQTFSGRQMMQRFERAYMPRHPGAARDGEIMTAVDRAMMSATDAEQVDSAAFKDGPGIQGVSVTRWELDDLNERGGGIIITDLPIWQVMADPESRAINLSDRAWHRYGKWWPQSEVKARWPEKYQDVVNRAGGSPYVPSEPTESSRIPWAGMSGNKPLEPYYPRGRMFWIEFEEWKEVKTYWEIGKPVDPTQSYEEARAAAVAGGQGAPDTMTTFEVDSKAEIAAWKDEYAASHPGFEVPANLIAQKRRVVYKYAYICGEDILETGDCPTGYWTFQFLTGFRFPLAKEVRFTSLVERLVDPQKFVNVMLSALIRNLQITPKGLLFVEEGFFRNRNEAMSSWASPGGLVMVGRGKLSSGQPGYKMESGGTTPYAQMVESLMSFYREAIPRLAGFNPGALGQLGSDLRRISGEVVRQVQDAAMTANAEPFDALRLYRRDGGKIFLSFLRRFFEVEDIIRIVGDDVAYRPVLDPTTGQPVPETQPVIDPATGQPATDPATGQPQTQPVMDEKTGEPKMQRQLAIPDKSSWAPDYWKEITVEDVVPSGDQLQVLWKSLETSIQMLLQPQPDTGQPLFTSEDLTKIVPGIPAQIREQMLQRIRAAKAKKEQDEAKAAQQQPQAPPDKPPATSINFKDLPPDGQSQLAQKAGIQLAAQGGPPPEQNGGQPPQQPPAQ